MRRTSIDSNDAPLIEAEQLSVGYEGANPLFGPLNFSVHPGQALAFVGENGSGKTTILRTLAGEVAELGGTVRTWGQVRDDRSALYRARVAHLFDADTYLPALSAREHLLLIARAHGISQASDLVTQELAEFGLAEHAHHRPGSLSSGQRRRLALAALFVRPRSLLILDEPEARLDHAMITRLSARLRGERERGGAMILASHSQELVAMVATNTIVLP